MTVLTTTIVRGKGGPAPTLSAPFTEQPMDGTLQIPLQFVAASGTRSGRDRLVALCLPALTSGSSLQRVDAQDPGADTGPKRPLCLICWGASHFAFSSLHLVVSGDPGAEPAPPSSTPQCHPSCLLASSTCGPGQVRWTLSGGSSVGPGGVSLGERRGASGGEGLA